MSSFNWREFLNGTALHKFYARGVDIGDGSGGCSKYPVRPGKIYEINFECEFNGGHSRLIVGDSEWLVDRAGMEGFPVFCMRFIPWIPRKGEKYVDVATSLVVEAVQDRIVYDPSIKPEASRPIVILSRSEEKPASVIDVFGKLMGV